MQVGLDLCRVRIGERQRGRALVDLCENQQQHRRNHDDGAEMRVNEEHREQENRRDRGIQEGEQRAGNEERPNLLQVSERLVFPPVALQGCPRRRAQDRCSELRCKFHCGSHKDETAQCVESGLKNDCTDDHDRQHDQRIRRPAGQDTVRDLEQIDRYGQHKHVAGDSKNHDDQEVAFDRMNAGLQAGVEVDLSQPLVERAAAPAAALAAAG